MQDGEPTAGTGGTILQRVLSRFQAVFDSLKELGGRFGTNLLALFIDDNHTFGQIVGRLGAQLLEDLLKVIEEIISGLFAMLAELLGQLAEHINTPTQIPVLSPLFKKISGRKLTVLDAVALIFAIPTTIVYKITRRGSFKAAGHQTFAGS